MTTDGMVDTDDLDEVDVDAPPAGGGYRGIGRVLLSIVLVAVVAAAVAVGYLWGNDSDSLSAPSTTSVDAGFARDMSTHHEQAITMAGYTRDNSDSSAIRILAYDIETSQLFQVGQMQGWLDVWGLPREYPTVMKWMAGHAHVQANGLMPGMASPAEMNTLQTLHGKALDIMFLQLMIRHHQGGIPMAQYAAAHAKQPYVRQLAQAMVSAQSAEIVSMEQQLRQLGASPLPPPS